MADVAAGEERFRVKVDGPDDAPVVLMSHSLGCDLTMWDDVVPALARSYRVVRYDTRGHGASTVVARPTSIAELADDALAILDDLGVERAHFVGLSMGGMIGQWLLRYAPERLDRVVLCNTSAKMAPPDLWNARIRTAREQGMAALLPATMERWFTPEFRTTNPDGLARVARMFETTDPEGYASCCAAIRDMDQRWPLRDVAADVTVLVGARDVGTTPAMGKAIADAIPGARLVTLDAAHISAVERPDDFAAAILAALSAPARRAPRAAARKPAPTPPRPAPARARDAARRPAAVKPLAPQASRAKPTATPTPTPTKAGVAAAAAKTPARPAGKPAGASSTVGRLAKGPAKSTARSTGASAKAPGKPPAKSPVKAPAAAGVGGKVGTGAKVKAAGAKARSPDAATARTAAAAKPASPAPARKPGPARTTHADAAAGANAGKGGKRGTGAKSGKSDKGKKR